MRHDALLSKAIWAIGINRLREMWRIDGLTGNRSPLLQFPVLVVTTIYLDSERRHEASKIELLVVQPLKELLGIGNTTPSRVVLSISHGM